MKLERRDFIRSATTGLAFGFAGCGEARGQSSAGELRAGSGTLYLEGRLKAGPLKLEAQDFVDRSDRAAIVRGTLASTELYSAMFSYQKDSTVFALFNDNGHSTSMILANSDDPKIGRIVTWNDGDTPQISSIDKSTIMESDDLKNIVNAPDLLGKRKPPSFTWHELESAFGSDPALQAFMRGRKTTHHPREEDKLLEWACRILCLVPGSLLPPIWAVAS
ncbi:MAG TPA: hypothetical protein VN875_11050 [Candidatus Binatus sp.]|nr:hypothetical protein [Candidatus Binatus sp.]